MKRSQINKAISNAELFFTNNNCYLPPNPKWDVTDFGLNEFESKGLVLVNLANELEYCEKLMFAKKNQITPEHFHKVKKEDIICRIGELGVILWNDLNQENEQVPVKINGEPTFIKSGELIVLKPGERITISPLQWHTFFPISDECIISEVSTANDDENDNFFIDKNIGRFPEIIEDEPASYKLINE